MKRSPLFYAGAAAAGLGLWWFTRSQSQPTYGPEYRPEELHPTKWVTGYKSKLPYPLQVKSVGDGEWLAVDAADAFLTMQGYALADGIRLTVNSGFRSMLEQTGLWVRWKAGLFHCGVPWDQPCSVATPGTSNHQQGKAVDLRGVSSDSPAFAWLLTNAGGFGFSWDEGQRAGEPWHWRYVG